MLMFHRGQPLYEGSTLVVVDSERGDDTPQDVPARPLGQGATGLVVRAIEQGLMPRAVKILAPQPELEHRLGYDALCSTFVEERKRLAVLTHSHIAKLISYGQLPIALPDRPHPLPYLVMDFVEGTRLHDYLVSRLDAAKSDAVDEVVELLCDVLSALSYLHARNAMHADVKEANILVRTTPERPEAILVDLGCAHIFDDDHEQTYFYSTPGRHGKLWNGRVNHPVDARELAKNRVQVDLFMFGVMLYLFMNEPVAGLRTYEWQEKVATLLKRVGALVSFYRVAAKCLARQYSDAQEAHDDLRRLLSGYVAPLGIPEISIGSDAKTSIALPDTRVVLTDRLTRIANHPCLQRLRDVTQLDLIRLVYPGASHTRLLHSYETYEVARQYVGTLLGNPYFRAYAADKASVEAVLLAALLHDVGHYALEHVFEDFAYKKETDSPYGDVMTDDQIATDILLDREGPVNDIMRRFLAEAADVLREPKMETLARVIHDKFGLATIVRLSELLDPDDTADAGLHIMRTILDGPLDADKVAYLRTDAMMTGARFGHGLDMDSLLGALTCIVTEDVATIAITEKGISAAEAIATARRWMYQRVYWHRTNRALMAMLRYPIQYTFEQGTLTFFDYLSHVFTMTDVEAIKFVHDRFRKALGSDHLENPALAIIAGRRGIYKRFLEFPSYAGEKQHAIHDYLVHRTCREWRGISTDVADQLRQFLPDIKASDVLLDVPVRDRPQMGDILVVDTHTPGEYQRLSGISEAFGSTKQFFIKASMLPRLFIHPVSLRKLAEDETLVSARNEATEYLYSRAEGKPPTPKRGKRPFRVVNN